MSEKVNIGTSNYTEVMAIDEIGHGGAHNEYAVIDNSGEILSIVFFQDGPVNETEINGIFHEDLIAILIHRLESFQEGEYKCRENEVAIGKLREALHWLNYRTQKREGRGVKGTSEV